MLLKTLSFGAVVCALGASPAFAGDKVLYGPVPDWVKVVEPAAPGAEAEASSLPVRIVLLDSQQRLTQAGIDRYSDIELKFQTPQGLQAANIALPWRQDSDELTIHHVLIHRGDQTIDVLKGGQTFTVLRREQNLDQSTLDGILTANMFPEGLQVGDVLEVAASTTSHDPVLKGHAEAAFGPLAERVGRAHVRLTWPVADKMALRETQDLPSWTRSRAGNFETAELTIDNPKPIALPDDAPLRYHVVRFAQASDFTSWAQLAELFEPLFKTAAAIPADGPLRAEVERIKAASTDPVKRAEGALDLVESRIRYVALELGQGGLVPATASETWSRRFGDCKAKTALLLGMLQELGIAAEPVLVNSEAGDVVEGRLPSVSAFNHVIVRAHIAGKDYWLDGTRTGDTSLARLNIPFYHWGLPVVASAQLVRMVPPPLTQPLEDLAIHMDASKGVRAPVPTTVELTMRGDAALGANQALANLVGDARDRALREYWRGRFSDIEPQKVSAAFDQSLGELRLNMEGTAKLNWNGTYYETDETGVGYDAKFVREAGYAQDAPYVVAYPSFRHTRETIILPPSFMGAVGKATDVDETVAGIEYKRHSVLTGNTLTIERSSRTVVPEFAASEAPTAQKRLREMYQNALYLRIPDGYHSTDADAGALAADTPTNVSDLLSQGNELLNAGKREEALARFTKAAERDPSDAMAWADRGVTLAWLRRSNEATEALDKAAALDPKNYVVFNGRGMVAYSRRDFAAAAAAYAKAIEINPKDTFAATGRLQSMLYAGKADDALSELAAASKKAPQDLDTYGQRVFLMMQTGHAEKAQAVLQEMLAANPNDPQARQAAGRLYNELGATDKAKALLGTQTLPPASSISYLARASSRAPGDIAGRLNDLGEAVKANPSDTRAIMARAQTYLAANRYEDALADAAQALKVDPKLPEAFLLRANIYTMNGRKDDALEQARGVVSANPTMPWAHAAAGRIYSHFGLQAEALAELDQAVKLDPDGNFFVDREAVRERSDWSNRLADLDEALRHHPGDDTALVRKAIVLREKGDHSGSVAVLTEMLNKSPANASVLNYRGVELALAGKVKESEADFAKAHDLASDGPTLNNLCYDKATAGVALQRALDECNAAVRKMPDAPNIRDSRGFVLLRLGRLDEAIVDFDSTLAKAPGMAPSLYGRAVAWSRKGDGVRATADAQAALKADPEIGKRFADYGLALEPRQLATAQSAQPKR